MRPEPKLVHTRAISRTLYGTHGPLWTYKLFACDYGGAKDDDLSNTTYNNTSNLQKWVNLYNLIMEPFKGKGIDV